MPRSIARLLTIVVALCAARTASAQFMPRTLNDPATGERYHIEAEAGLWKPTADMSISSESLGIVGSTIDFKRDLGLTDQRFTPLRLVLRPGRKHKFRLESLPITFEQSATLTRTITFNGQLYRIGLPVNSSLSWKTYRLGYEYDFIYRDRGFGGFFLEAKFSDVEASLQSPILSEYARARAPIPAIGGIFRVYPAANIAITGEVGGITLPEGAIPDIDAHLADIDFYGTVNLTNNVGVKAGYRSIDVGYHVDRDRGTFVLKGLYFGLVARY